MQDFLNKTFFLILFWLFSVPLYGQFDQLPVTDTLIADSSKIKVIFIRKFKAKETPEGRFQELIGDVHLQQLDMHLWCDLGYIKPQKQVEAFGNVQILQADSIRVFSDSLFYDGISRLAQLRQNVVLEDSSMTLFTDELDYNLNTRIATFPTGSLIETDTMTLISKKGQYDANTNMAYFEDSVRITGSDYKLTADSLAFNTETEKAFFLGATTIYHGEKTIYCEDGFYDSKNEYAELRQNARFENKEEGKEELATGDKIIFDGKKEMYYLIGNAFYQNADQEVEADTILMDAKTEQYYFKGQPKFKSRDSTQNQSIDAKFTTYDAETKTMIFRGDVIVAQDNSILTTDSLDYNSENKNGLARGNVVWVDTVEHTQISCQVAQYNDSTKYLKAYGNPVLQSQIDGDTLWLRADTLISIPADTSQQDSSQDARNLKAFHHVRVYKSDMQAVCDSLYYNALDSTFQFYQKPVLWVDGTQFAADSIKVKLKNNKIYRVFLRQNSFIVNRKDSLYHNQVKGDNMTTKFVGEHISSIEIKGNGETVYYAEDDKGAYIGVNDVDCVDMFLFFNNNELRRIRFEGKPTAILYPMGQAPHEQLKLKGFRWLEQFRPKNKYDIL